MEANQAETSQPRALWTRKQIGPLTQSELFALCQAIAANPASEAALVAKEIDRLATKQNILRRGMLARTLGGLGGPCHAWNDNVLVLLDPEDLVFAPGPENTIDYLAYYRPYDRADLRGGIYFVHRTIAPLLAAHPSIDVPEFLKALAVHELFHYFVQRLLNDDAVYQAHGCHPWCDLEEAAADFVARRSAAQNPQALSGFDHLLFAKLGSPGGLHGYGEYHLLDDRIVDAITALKFNPSSPCPAPAGYAKALTLTLGLALPTMLNSGGRALFAAILASVDEGSIPFYFDMAN